MREATDSVRKIVTAMVDRAIARCAEMGIAVEDFHRAMAEEQKINSKDGPEKLFARTFQRLRATMT